MTSKIDIKSALLGLGLGVAATFAVAASNSSVRAAGVKFLREDVLSGPGGSQIWLLDPSGNLIAQRLEASISKDKQKIMKNLIQYGAATQKQLDQLNERNMLDQ